MAKGNYFSPVDPKVNFPELEKKLLDKWYTEGTVDKYLARNDSSDKYFSFIDGPITANNPMGVHHAWGRTYKDLWQRFKNMQGFKQRFQNGFDSQGLWVEVEVEKELGFRSKKDIEEFGVAKFVDLCKQRVVKYSGIQTQQSKRLGYFMDWDNSYYTMSDDNNYMIWHFLKVCQQNGWIYKGNESVPWCPRCETAISQHEMLTEDYKEVSHDSIIMEFPLKENPGEFLLVWTTTPWTIPANIAVAVDENLDYSLAEGDTKDKFWIATQAVQRVFGSGAKTLKTVKGKELVGLTYSGPFDWLPAVEKVAKDNPDTFHKVIATDERIMPITTTEGTGMVHTAVSAGTEDFRLGKKLGLPMIPVIADNADYLPGLDFLTGQNAKKHPEIILDYLRREDEKEGVDWVFDIFAYKHRYPACWRCKSELVWKVTDEWYIAMDLPSKAGEGNDVSADGRTLRQRMVDVTKKINWIPKFGLKRELDWLSNMSDWLISKKNRYWGLALPIWECPKCSDFEIIGSKDELEKRAVEGWSEFEGKSPHKPQIDQVKIRCSKCDQVVSRIEPVGNPWLDAGIVPYSTISPNNKAATINKTQTQPLYLTDKTKWENWFPADFITESFPGQFKNWFYAMIAMSTVLEDRNPFESVLGFATLLAEDGRPMHKSWGNSIEFNEGADRIGVDVMRWIYTRQNPSENLLFGYKTGDEVRRRFHLKLWNSYNYFVTYATLDGWEPNKHTIDGSSTHLLDIWILSRLENLVSSVTTDLENFNTCLASESIENFVDDLSNWYIRRSRDRVGASSTEKEDKDSFFKTTYTVLTNLSKLLAPFTPFLADEIYFNLTKEESVHLSDWPVFKYSTDEKLIGQMQTVRELVEKIHAQRKEKQIPVRQPLIKVTISSPHPALSQELENIARQEVNVKNFEWKKAKELELELDTTITAEIEEETKTRELIRSIQNQRKNLGIDITQKIEVFTPWLPTDQDLTERIRNKTLATTLKKADELKIIPS